MNMMVMRDYLNEINHAIGSLIPLIWQEELELRRLDAAYAALYEAVRDDYRRAEFMQLNAYDPEDVAAAAGEYWGTYFGGDRELNQIDVEIKRTAEQRSARRFSRAALSGSVLQFAKQGISLCHTDANGCPDGRAIGRQPLKLVIWEARNQALHWEDGQPRRPQVACFDSLVQDFGESFSGFRERNMAFEVVRLLDWTTLANFEGDMLLLA